MTFLEDLFDWFPQRVVHFKLVPGDVDGGAAPVRVGKVNRDDDDIESKLDQSPY